ncbi:MAG TPA: gliding motility-associated C-terminal domain-containing protein, partial [Saprospiraceae bacterium]|nr:gliding motility-associated C-terminal domain-containing protein [Saprospiraceae bacterium]
SLLLVGPLTDVFTTSDFTVSFFMRPAFPPKGGTSQVILSKQENCDAKTGFWVRYSKNNKISSGISENGSLVSIVQASLDRDLCWQYITLVRSNTRYSLYVNGKLRDSKTASGRINLSSNAPVKVSQPICAYDQNYFGDLDNLRFHNKALSADDISRYFIRPDRILNSDTLLYLGNSLQINVSATCATQFNWTPVSGTSASNIANPVLSPIVPTTYAAEFIHFDTITKGRCIARDTIRINVIDPDTLDCDLIFVPNAFTPGGSPGRNDLFGISNPFSVTDFISFEIFDRWGGKVFSAASPFDTWNGTFQDQPLNAGVFLYRLRYRCREEEKVKSGTLTLLR